MPEIPDGAKKPDDHKAKNDAFAFTATTLNKKGEPVEKTFTLPPFTDGVEQVPAWISQDAILSPEDETAQVRLAMAVLAASEVDGDARAALRTMTTGRMLEVLGEWMGESQGSSA